MSKKTTKNDEAVEQSGAVGKMKSVLEENVNLRTALRQIEKQFGEGAIMPLGADRRGPIPGIPT
ncbi:MAG TPA: DNA recombination/repair protein RecA, partial [Candidatus Anammoximicrobium sp.]|nr:DNA recombination/repair protein RecA [Candidatus Anammoximicrobium sp.]